MGMRGHVEAECGIILSPRELHKREFRTGRARLGEDLGLEGLVQISSADHIEGIFSHPRFQGKGLENFVNSASGLPKELECGPICPVGISRLSSSPRKMFFE